METHIVSVLPESALHRTTCQGSIVVVEDPFIQKYLRIVLSRQGYRVIGVDARTAIEMLGSAFEPVDLVITNSPRDFMTVSKTVRLLYIAGAPDPDLASCFARCRVLRKPFHPDQLLALVKDLTGSV